MRYIKRDKIKNNSKAGALLPLVALGIVAVAGMVPFLISNTDTNQKLNVGIDEANKITWAIESAAHEKLKSETSSESKGLGEATAYEENKGSINFNYGDESGFKAIGEVVQYNSFLNKNSCIVARGSSSRGDDVIDMHQLTYGVTKPGVSTINNITYCWNKNGKLFEVDPKTNQLVAIPNVDKVWQVVSDGTYPIVLTTSRTAVQLIPNGDKYNTKELQGDFYQLAENGGNFSAGITSKNQLADFEGNTIFNKENNKVEDLAVSNNHGLFLVAKNPDNPKEGYELWGWGDNAAGQINCVSGVKQYNTPTTVACTLKSKEGVTSGSISPMNDFTTISDYFSGTYKYAGQTIKAGDSNGGGACIITNPYRGEDPHKHLGANQDQCTCPLCLDVWDLHKQDGVVLSTNLKITEEQAINNLQLMLDSQGLSDTAKKGISCCKLTNLDTGEVINFIGKQPDLKESIVSPLGNVYLVDIVDKDIGYSDVRDKDMNVISKGSYYTLKEGNYNIEFGYLTKTSSTGRHHPAPDDIISYPHHAAGPLTSNSDWWVLNGSDSNKTRTDDNGNTWTKNGNYWVYEYETNTQNNGTNKRTVTSIRLSQQNNELYQQTVTTEQKRTYNTWTTTSTNATDMTKVATFVKPTVDANDAWWQLTGNKTTDWFTTYRKDSNGNYWYQDNSNSNIWYSYSKVNGYYWKQDTTTGNLYRSSSNSTSSSNWGNPIATINIPADKDWWVLGNSINWYGDKNDQNGNTWEKNGNYYYMTNSSGRWAQDSNGNLYKVVNGSYQRVDGSGNPTNTNTNTDTSTGTGTSTSTNTDTDTSVDYSGYTFTKYQNDALFWGIDPKAKPEAELIAQKQKTQGTGYFGGSSNLTLKNEELFGAIFRLNTNMFNLRGGMEYDDEVPTYYALAAGDNFSLAIIARKTDMPTDKTKLPPDFYIVGWGNNEYGQCGVDVPKGDDKNITMTIMPSAAFEDPDDIKKYRDMKAGKYHALFLTTDGKVYGWGGETQKALPHRIKSLSGIVSISAGYETCSALDKNGYIYTWTPNSEDKIVKIDASGRNFKTE